MASSSAQIYLQTRVQILASRLRSDAALADLLESGNEELARTLDLGALLEELLPGERKNRLLEQTLLQRMLDETVILLRPLGGGPRKVLKHWFQKFELFNLKALIRGKINGLEAREIQDHLHDLPASITLPHTELLRTESVNELLRTLEQGPYRDLAVQARRSYEENQEPFLLDATIDQRFYTALGEHARNCEGPDRQPLQALTGTLIDRQNLLLLLRYRFCYELTPSETYYLLSPHGLVLNRRHLLQLVNLGSLEKVVESLPGPLGAGLRDSRHPMDVDFGLRRLTRKALQQHLRASPSIAARSLAYLVLREEELRRVFSLLQGRILGLSRELIEQAMGLGADAPEPDQETGS